MPKPSSCSSRADPDFRVRDEIVRRQHKVGWCRPLPNAAGRVVNGAVARAEIAVIRALFGERYATEMRADRDQHLPLFMPRLYTRGIWLWIRQLGDVDVLRVLDLFLGPVRDEYRLAAPEHLDRLSLRNRSEVDLHGRTSGDRRSVRIHLRDEWPDCRRGANSCERAGGGVQDVSTH